MSLQDRCREFLTSLNRNAILRQGSPLDDLVAFVLDEINRCPVCDGSGKASEDGPSVDVVDPSVARPPGYFGMCVVCCGTGKRVTGE